MMPIDHTKIYQRYKGKWVVLDPSQTKVLTSDLKLKTAIEKFRQRYGRRQLPIVFKVPTEILPLVG